MRQVERPDEVAVVLDFGAQYNHLICRKIRQCHVYSELLPHDTSISQLRALGPKAIVLSGGPASVYADGAPTVDAQLFELGIPILGICYGHQLMAHLLGGEVARGDKREYGATELDIESHNDLFVGLGPHADCWMSHGDRVVQAPPGFQVAARTKHTPVAAMADAQRKLYGVQFHPEVTHTPQGLDILSNFLLREAGCTGTWRPASFVEAAVADLRQTLGDARALCALSGGVDSAVAAALTEEAIGDRLTCIFVDHGLLRAGEAEQVCAVFGARMRNFVHVDAAERFLQALRGVVDPEEKRRIIGEQFIRVFEAEASKLGGFDFIVHGTLYPDVIESGGHTAATIKTHHNVGGLPADMGFANVEPLRLLFKDEARQVGEELGLPEEIVWRQPFPGPGLAVRIVGEVTPERLDTLRQADAILLEELGRSALLRETSQTFAVLAPNLRSVGVMGDERSYGQPVIIRSVTTEDFMTADWSRLPHEDLARISTRMVNEVEGINRVLYDITSKPPATVEYE